MLSKFYFHGPEERGPKGNIICRRKNTMEIGKKKSKTTTSIRILEKKEMGPSMQISSG